MENLKKHSLGNRAFLLFFSRRLKLPIFLLALTAAVWYSERWLPVDYAGWGAYAAEMLLLLSGGYILALFMLTYLEYRVYTYTFTDEAFVMTSGLAVRNEVAALYHQIQNVNIIRRPLDRMVGVSQVIIFMTGAEREAGHNKIVLPAVGRTKAKLVQKELLTRARKHVPAGFQE
jgi:membrane protein YdbS with pleckstrin-like domain